MDISQQVIEELTKDCKTQEDFNELFRALKKRGLEAALAGELTDHLGYDKHIRHRECRSNSRNGYSKKQVTTAHGPLELEVLRDRMGEFEPQLMGRYLTRFDGVDDKIIALYARGLSVQDIQSELAELYGDAISTTLISNVTAAVLDDVRIWQSCP